MCDGVSDVPSELSESVGTPHRHPPCWPALLHESAVVQFLDLGINTGRPRKHDQSEERQDRLSDHMHFIATKMRCFDVT